MHRKSLLLNALCIVVLTFIAGQPRTLAQSSQTPTPAPSPQFLSLTVVSVKPEMVTEFQNFMKNTTNPALKKGGLAWRDVWQSTSAAGDAFEYVIVAPVNKLAEFDGPGALEKGLGSPQNFAAWQTKAGSLVNSVRRSIIRTRPELGYAPERLTAPKMAVVHSVHVAPDRIGDYENYLMNSFTPVMKQAKVTYLVAQVVFGGNATEYITLTMRDTFADLDKGPVTVQALGAEEARKLQQKMPAGTVVHLERSLSRFVPELSIMAANP